MRRRFWMALAVGLATAIGVSAQQPDLTVGDIQFSSLRWGNQTAEFDIVNHTARPKFVTVMTEIQFEGGYLTPNRRARSSYAIPPEETIKANASMLIPANYGHAQATVKVYDVIDTLDAILPGQQIFEQPFTLNFNVPEGMAPYLEERITLPPRVEDHPYFDNDLSRVIFLLLDKGMTPGAIADLAMCDTAVVMNQVQTMMNEGYARINDKKEYVLAVPFISVDEAAAAKVISDKLADTLTALIAGRVDTYKKYLDSLVAAGVVPTDSNQFYNGGTALYHPYPVIGGLGLWWVLGHQFITRSAPFVIFDGTDICNADIPTFMYAVQGGAALNGHQFYFREPIPTGDKIVFSDSIPKIVCPDDFIKYKRIPKNLRWTFDPDKEPTNFMMDTALVRSALNTVTHGTEPLLVETYTLLKTLAIDHGHPKLEYGYRYWFWNLTASRILDRLVEQGVLTRKGSGTYQFTGMQG